MCIIPITVNYLLHVSTATIIFKQPHIWQHRRWYNVLIHNEDICAKIYQSVVYDEIKFRNVKMNRADFFKLQCFKMR
jgi:hypothetical protein